MSDGRRDKIEYYERKLQSFDYAGLKREEALDLLRLSKRLFRDCEHMNEVKNRVQQLETLVERKDKEIRRMKRKEVGAVDHE
jgi:CII-binding regulator of phage lambda lysogenization HflD